MERTAGSSRIPSGDKQRHAYLQPLFPATPAKKSHTVFVACSRWYDTGTTLGRAMVSPQLRAALKAAKTASDTIAGVRGGLLGETFQACGTAHRWLQGASQVVRRVSDPAWQSAPATPPRFLFSRRPRVGEAQASLPIELRGTNRSSSKTVFRSAANDTVRQKCGLCHTRKNVLLRCIYHSTTQSTPKATSGLRHSPKSRSDSLSDAISLRATPPTSRSAACGKLTNLTTK